MSPVTRRSVFFPILISITLSGPSLASRWTGSRRGIVAAATAAGGQTFDRREIVRENGAADSAAGFLKLEAVQPITEIGQGNNPILFEKVGAHPQGRQVGPDRRASRNQDQVETRGRAEDINLREH